MVPMAAHLRKIGALSRLLAWSTKLSIQEPNFRRPLPLVMPGVVFEAINIFLRVIAFVPADLAVVWDGHIAVVFEWDGFEELGLDEGDDAVFVGFGVHDGDGVVVLEHDNGVAGRPDAKHGGVDYVRQRALWVVGYGFSEYPFIIPSPPKLSFSSSKGNKGSTFSEG